MKTSRSNPDADMRVILSTRDAWFEQLARTAFSTSARLALTVFADCQSACEHALESEDSTVAVIDLTGTQNGEMEAIERLMARSGGKLPVLAVVESLDAEFARTLLQMRVADFLLKPVSPVDLIRSCERVLKRSGAP